MVSPGLLVSEQVAALTVRARYGFVALLMYLDDEGRGKDNASAIRAHCWPLDDAVTTKKMSEDLTAMETEGLICRYEIGGSRYLHSPTWHTHQKINRATESKLPPCPLHEDSLNPHGALTEPSRPIEVKRSEVQEKPSQVKRAGRDLTSRSAALAAAYIAKQPLANRYQVQGIIAQAIGEAGYPDEQVAAALERLASAGMTVTQNTLLVELNGQRKTSTTNQRVGDALVIAQRLREQETIPSQRAIGAGS